MDTFSAILITGAFAILGWIFTARRSWALSRKQHTINIILQANFDDDFLRDREAIAPMVRQGGITLRSVAYSRLGKEFRRILNHYEFVAAAVRAGDVDEALLKSSEGTLYVQLVEASRGYISDLQTTENRDTLFKNLLWLHARWVLDPPNVWQRFWERVAERPSHPNSARLKALQGGFD